MLLFADRNQLFPSNVQQKSDGWLWSTWMFNFVWHLRRTRKATRFLSPTKEKRWTLNIKVYLQRHSYSESQVYVAFVASKSLILLQLDRNETARQQHKLGVSKQIIIRVKYARILHPIQIIGCNKRAWPITCGTMKAANWRLLGCFLLSVTNSEYLGFKIWIVKVWRQKNFDNCHVQPVN